MSEVASDYAIYRQVVTQLMSGEEQLPSLPTITLDIRRALSDPEVTLAQLSRLISRDPALSAILMKYASSALLRTQQAPKSLLDVLRVLGMAQIDRLTMAHSVKSLFILHSPAHKKLFVEAWERLVRKASVSAASRKDSRMRGSSRRGNGSGSGAATLLPRPSTRLSSASTVCRSRVSFSNSSVIFET